MQTSGVYIIEFLSRTGSQYLKVDSDILGQSLGTDRVYLEYKELDC